MPRRQSVKRAASELSLFRANLRVLPTERDETAGCALNTTPEDHLNYAAKTPTQILSALMNIDIFMRFLDQPTPAPPTSSTINGQNQFNSIGCVLCHTTSFTTGSSSVTALSHIQANLFSDLLIHHMGPGLADNIAQGAAPATCSELQPCGEWDSGSSFFTMEERPTC